MNVFSKTYELSLTRGYVSGWGMAQAVRELIQNAIDRVEKLDVENVSTAIHPHSRAAYHEGGERFGARALAVVAKLRALGAATDKQIARALGYEHKAAVQPRISELVGAGVLEECGETRDTDTGKTVRVVRVRPAANGGERQIDLGI